mmetsp:Transcript_34445/g.50000  ORF Transcript_34445/g.50000 Transcript_34445/m.50000 type:complete len:143 (+) Transcript_34445:446-874(+)
MDEASSTSPSSPMISMMHRNGRKPFKSSDRLYDIAHENYFKETSLQHREENYKAFVPRFEFGEMIRRSNSLCGLPGYGEKNQRSPIVSYNSVGMNRRSTSVNNLHELSLSNHGGSFLRPRGMRKTSSAAELAELGKEGTRMA